MLSDLIIIKLKEIIKFQDILKQILDIISQNMEQFIMLVNILCLFPFLSDICKGYLPLKDVDDKQS